MAVTSNGIITASEDYDLKRRFTAIAAYNGVPNPGYFVEQHFLRLVSSPVADKVEGEDDPQAIAQVYEWAVGQYNQELADIDMMQRELDGKRARLLKPGVDTSRVSDTQIAYAIQTVQAALAPAPAAGE